MEGVLCFSLCSCFGDGFAVAVDRGGDVSLGSSLGAAFPDPDDGGGGPFLTEACPSP